MTLATMDGTIPSPRPPAPPRNPTKSATPLRTTDDLLWWAVGGIVVVAVGFLLVATFSPASDQGIKDTASALALITATAVGIERSLEVFWNFVDTTQGSFWPLTEIDKKINQLVDQISTDVRGPLLQLKNVVADADKVANWSQDQLAAFPGEIDAISDQIQQLKQLAPTSDNAQAIATYATHALAAVSTRYPSIKADCDAAAETVNAISDFVNSLNDNPGRRILSIYAGAVMGLLIVVALGLDIFMATLGTPLTTEIKGLGVDVTFKFGVAATGIVIGLGSNPTHELIKVLQTYKQNLKTS